MLDFFGDGFVLVRFGGAASRDEALMAAAAEAGVPLSVVELQDARLARLYERRLVLVRPDGHVAWRGESAPDDCTELIATVTGRP
jgi:hypothetical protein